MRIPPVLRPLTVAAVAIAAAGCTIHHGIERPGRGDNPFKVTSEDVDSKTLLSERELRLQARQLYRQAREATDSGEYDTAIKRYDQLIARYPFSDFSTQAEMEKVFALYKNDKPDEALSAADRFLRAHPRHPHADYVQYIKGLADYGRDQSLANVVSANNPKRDVSNLRRSFEDFALLLQKYPDSPYAGDARRRMLYARNRVADHELSIAHFYYADRGAYVAAAKRASDIIADYPGAPATAQALEILQNSYTKLGLQQQAADAKTLAALNPTKVEYQRAPAATLVAAAEPAPPESAAPPTAPAAATAAAAAAKGGGQEAQGGVLHGVSTTLGSGLAAIFGAVGIGKSSDHGADASSSTAAQPAAAGTTAPAGTGTQAAANGTAAAPAAGGNPISRVFNGLVDKLLQPGAKPPEQYKAPRMPKSQMTPGAEPTTVAAASGPPDAAAAAPAASTVPAAAPAAVAATAAPAPPAPATAAPAAPAAAPDQSLGLMGRFAHMFNVFDTTKPENQHVLVLPSGNGDKAGGGAGSSAGGGTTAGTATANGSTLHMEIGYPEAHPGQAAPAKPADTAAAPPPAAPPAAEAAKPAADSQAAPQAAAQPAKSGGFFTWFAGLFSFADPDKQQPAPQKDQQQKSDNSK